MITTYTHGTQTGAFSRIANPYSQITPQAIGARVQRRSIQPPTRNMLAGAVPTSIWGRVQAWFRGEI